MVLFCLDLASSLLTLWQRTVSLASFHQGIYRALFRTSADQYEHFALVLASTGHTHPAASKRALIVGFRVFTLTLGSVSLHRFGASHQPSLRSLRTMVRALPSAKRCASPMAHLRGQCHDLPHARMGQQPPSPRALLRLRGDLRGQLLDFLLHFPIRRPQHAPSIRGVKEKVSEKACPADEILLQL